MPTCGTHLLAAGRRFQQENAAYDSERVRQVEYYLHKKQFGTAYLIAGAITQASIRQQMFAQIEQAEAAELFTVLICGARDWTNLVAIERELTLLDYQFGRYLKVVHGACEGRRDRDGKLLTSADMMADWVCQQRNIAVQAYPARWEVTAETPTHRIKRRTNGEKYDCAAGPIRNQQMLDSEHIKRILAFHTDLTRSKGTLDMVNRAEKAGIPVFVFSS